MMPLRKLGRRLAVPDGLACSQGLTRVVGSASNVAICASTFALQVLGGKAEGPS